MSFEYVSDVMPCYRPKIAHVEGSVAYVEFKPVLNGNYYTGCF